MLHIIIFFITALIATTLSSMSGGGASVITVPVMLALGVSYPLAIATQKTSSIFWVLPASRNYLKDRKINWGFLLPFSLIGLLGVYLGVIFVISINQRKMELVIGTLILCLVIYTIFNKKVGLSKEKIYSKLQRAFSYFFAPILGFYEALFGSGNGIMFSIVAFKTRGFDFVDALGYYYSVAFPWAVFATILYIKNGYFKFSLMIPIMLGSLLGGYIGSRYAKHKGNKFIKAMFVFVGTILAIKLLAGF